MNLSILSRFVSVRNLLLSMLFVVVVMAIYFALIPTEPYGHSGVRVEGGRYDDYGKFSTMEVDPVVLDYDNDTWIDSARAVAKRGGVVYTTMVNDAYFEFAASWLCNTRGIGNTHERVLFLATDKHTAQRLKSLAPATTVVTVNALQFAGSQEYSQAGYVRMMVERTRFLLKLLEARLRVFLFEVDCLWLSDPLPTMLSDEFASCDIVGTKVTGQNVVAGGFLLLRPTEATLKLWRKLTEMMESLRDKILNSASQAWVSESDNDQQYLTRLISSKYADVKIGFLPDSLFPDGKWYKVSEAERASKPKPLIINNNWVRGNAPKIVRAKQFGHWFWDSGKRACDATALHNLFGA